jgi:hypothetical protein
VVQGLQELTSTNCVPSPVLFIFQITAPVILFSSRRYTYFDVVVGFVWSHDPKSYAGGSVCHW